MDVTVFIKTQGIIIKLENRTDGRYNVSADYNTGRKYWNKLKQRMLDEGNQLVTNCHQLKLTGKMIKKFSDDK